MGLNPVLRNPWMAIHPPLVFVGYAFATAPFALACAGVFRRDFSSWAAPARAWSAMAWAFLGAGIFCGSYWAYIILGWGGYWAWDPVENASLFPWLALAALSHGLILQGRGNRFAAWNVTLSALALLMVFMATFLTRSGVMSEFSKHSFQQSELYLPILYTFVGFTGVCLAMIALAAVRFRETSQSTDANAPLGKRMLSWTALVLILTLGFVLLGTTLPLFSKWEFLGALPLAGKIFSSATTVEQSYYNKTSYLMMFITAALLVWCPFVFVKAARGLNAPVRFAFAGGGAILGLLLVFVSSRGASPGAAPVLYYALSALAGAVIGANLANALHFYALRRWNLAGYMIHIGAALMIWGVLFSSAGEIRENVVLDSTQPHKGKLATYTLAQVRDNKKGDGVIAYIDVAYANRTHRTFIDFSFSERGMQIHPAIINYGFGDIYLAPKPIDFPEEQAGNTVTVGMEGFAPVGNYQMRVAGFNTDNMRTMKQVIVILDVQSGGQTSSLELPYSPRTRQEPSTLPDGTTVAVVDIIRETQSVVLATSAPKGHFQEEKDAASTSGPQADDGLAVGRAKPVTAGKWTLLLTGWDISAMQENRIGVKISATGNDHKSVELVIPYQIEPVDENGNSATLPDGTGIRVVRISVDPGNPDLEFAVLEVTGAKDETQAETADDSMNTPAAPESSASPARTYSISPGAPAMLDQGALSFAGHDNGPSGNDIIHLQLSAQGAQTVPMSIGFDPAGKMPPESLNLFFRDGSMWQVESFDPNTKTVVLTISSAPQGMQPAPAAAKQNPSGGASVVVEFAALRKPFIFFLWIGMILVSLGALIAGFSGMRTSAVQNHGQ